MRAFEICIDRSGGEVLSNEENFGLHSCFLKI